jgi:hypothetical protein
MDLFDLRNHLDKGGGIAETADFLMQRGRGARKDARVRLSAAQTARYT